MEIVSLKPNSTNAFTIVDDLKWQSKIKALKDGKKVKISIAEITCSVVDQDKAVQELSEITFAKLHKLYCRLHKIKKEMVLDIYGYQKLADRIVNIFNQIVRMESYFNDTGNEIFKQGIISKKLSLNYKFNWGWLIFLMMMEGIVVSMLFSVVIGEATMDGLSPGVIGSILILMARKAFYRSLFLTPTQNRIWKIYGKYALLLVVFNIIFTLFIYTIIGILYLGTLR